jgi:hypothetical protein
MVSHVRAWLQVQFHRKMISMLCVCVCVNHGLQQNGSPDITKNLGARLVVCR